MHPLSKHRLFHLLPVLMTLVSDILTMPSLRHLVSPIPDTVDRMAPSPSSLIRLGAPLPAATKIPVLAQESDSHGMRPKSGSITIVSPP